VNAGTSRASVGAFVLGCGLLACHPTILTAPQNSTLTLFANPPFIVVEGGSAVISALILKPNGTPAADGTVVDFFTDLGHIDPSARTTEGVARVNLVSDSRSGTATVNALSGGVVAAQPVMVRIGSILPSLILVTADPTRLTSNRTSRIVANVFDTAGNPVQNVAVFLTLQSNPIEETLDSGGTPLFTDGNGRVEDFLTTRRARDASQKAVVVTARVVAGTGTVVTGTVTVTVN